MLDDDDEYDKNKIHQSRTDIASSSTSAASSSASSSSSLSPFLISFTAGIMAEALSCILWVPIDVIKERMQVQQIPMSSSQYHSNPPYYRNVAHAVRSIVGSEGLRGLYRGYGATLWSFGPYSAIFFLCYEYNKAFLLQVSPSIKERHISEFNTANEATFVLPFSSLLLWYYSVTEYIICINNAYIDPFLNTDTLCFYVTMATRYGHLNWQP